MDSVELALARSVVEVAAGRRPLARDVLEQALNEAPDEARLLARLAEEHLESGDSARARQTADAACRADPVQADAWMVAALAAGAQARHEQAVRHAQRAIELLPADPAARLLYGLMVDRYAKSTKAMRAEGKFSLTIAGLHAAPGSRVKVAGAEVAISAIDLDARSGPNRATVRDLRTLVGAGVDTAPAHQRLTEYVWRTLLRLVGLFWGWAAIVAVTSTFAGPSVLRLVDSAVLGAFGFIGVRSLRRARRRLPKGYLGMRARRPEAVLGLLVFVVALPLALIGHAAITIDRGDTATTLGYVVVLTAVGASALAHLLLFIAWVRPAGGAEDRDANWVYAMSGVILVVPPAVVIGGVLALLHGVALRPDGAWAFAVFAAIVVATLCVEAALSFIAETPWVPGAIMLPILLLPAAGCALLMVWALRRLVFG
ncbi:hypothetical protein IU485_06180 [Nocardia cyriacigeorgica]|uniref:tetratricopeptide repeat protein n=1 Tax=Nocardia cyriacigeorgica TaxID=135487 RepID=UPI001893DBAD|nr:hypothetical protein [Nocardia cyriacigeorgica]MBF6080943.1 hypothetical protein [Nocardia cyriacigeorgica]